MILSPRCQGNSRNHRAAAVTEGRRVGLGAPYSVDSTREQGIIIQSRALTLDLRLILEWRRGCENEKMPPSQGALKMNP